MKLNAIIIAVILSLVCLSGLTPQAASTQIDQASGVTNLPQQQASPTPPKPNEAEQGSVIRVETVLKTMQVIAERGGKFVPDLQAKNFHVFEEGVEQEIVFFHSLEEPATIALMLDVSDSTAPHLAEIQEAAIAFTNQLHPQDHVIVVTFDSQTWIRANTDDHQKLHAAIRATRSGKGTRLYEAVDVIIKKYLNQIRGRKAIVLFTDGIDTGSKVKMESNLRLVEEADIFIYPIQYKTIPASAIASFYLRSLAEKTGGSFYLADSTRNLAKYFSQIAAELTKQYGLDYYPSATVEPGQRRKIKVTVELPGIKVRTRESYLSALPEDKAK